MNGARMGLLGTALVAVGALLIGVGAALGGGGSTGWGGMMGGAGLRFVPDTTRVQEGGAERGTRGRRHVAT